MVSTAPASSIAFDPARAEAVIAEYKGRTPTSAALAERARAVLPGGDTRTVAFHPPYPVTTAHGQGCRFEDVDGNVYIDLINNYTSLIHGHAHPAILEAVQAQLPKGTTFATALECQTRLAEIITSRVASVEQIRFANSGTEAVMNAIRAARAFTGRDLLVKMEGGYHGSYDDIEVSVHPDLTAAGDASSPIPVLDTRGVPANTVDNVLIAPFNDAEALERLMAQHGELVAAIIVEPVMGAAGVIPAEDGFLTEAERLAHEYGALLIADEVMTFRLEAGGAQEHYGITPDLTTFAKIIGGGFPVGAFGGRREIMAQFDPSQPNFLTQSGTFNGNAITMVAGIAAMEHYPAEEVARVNRLGDQLREGLAGACRQAELPATVTGYGSMVGVHLVDGPVRRYRDAAAVDKTLRRALHTAMLLEGLFAAPRLMFCISTPMDEATIDEVAERFGRALTRVVA